MLRKATAGETRNGVDKISQYRWEKAGDKPSLEWVEKGLLSVDDSYQRAERLTRILALASDWSWLACGALIVVRRRDGSMVVVDGQHRWLAACRRSDINELPCCVFDETKGGTVDEAAAFIRANTNRKTVRTDELFGARVAAEQPPAIQVDDLIKSIGRHVSSKPSSKSVACVASLIKCAEKDGDALARIWPLAAEMCFGGPMPEAFVTGMHYVECMLRGIGSLAREPFAARVRRLGCDALLRAAQKSAMNRGTGGVKSWGLGIATEINKGTRTNKIPVVE